SPALTTVAPIRSDKNFAAPGLEWRITTISTFIDKILLTVSISVSPFLTDELAAEKLTVSADNRFSANSKESLVLVEFSKNKLAIVISRSEGTFLIGRLITCLKASAVLKINSISFAVKSLIPIK